MASITITAAEILEALAQGSGPTEQPNTYTGEEIRAAMGWHNEKFRAQMIPLIQSGQVTVTQKKKARVDGRVVNVSAYHFATPQPIAR